MKNKLLSFLPFYIVVGISLITVLPLFHNGFFPMHDNTQVQRVFEMHKSLKDGMFPVRWVEDLGYGYGYPLFNFYGPLAYYTGGFFVFLFGNSLLATKLMIGLGMIGSGLTMYLLANSLWGRLGGITSSVLYLFAPYHAVDLYVRGDIGELWAYVFFPLAFFGFYKLYQWLQQDEFLDENVKLATRALPSPKGSKIQNLKLQFKILNRLLPGISIASVGFAGVILSHNLSAFMVTPFLVLFILMLVLFSKQKLHTAYYILLTVILGLTLSAFYWLPVFAEMKYTNVLSQVGGGADFHNHFVCLSQLWQSQWGFGGSVPGCVDGFSFMLGKIHIILSLFALFLLPFVWKKKNVFVAGVLSLVGLIASILLMLSVSQTIWEKVPQMAFLQYPWRYLLLASLFTSLLGGMVNWVAFQKQKIIGICIFIALLSGVIFLYGKYFQSQLYESVTSQSLTSPLFLHWTTSKISDEYMPSGFHKPSSVRQLPIGLIHNSSTVVVKYTYTRTNEKNVQIEILTPQFIVFNQAYFPGWKVFEGTKQLALEPAKEGSKVYLTSGLHTLHLIYQGTTIERISNLISLTSVIILILGIIWRIPLKKYEHKSI